MPELDKIKYINLDVVAPKYSVALLEFSRVCKIDTPIVISYGLSKPSIEITNFYPADYLLLLDEIPEGVEIHRQYFPNASGGDYLVDPGVQEIHYHMPVGFDVDTNRLMIQSIVEVLRQMRVESHSSGNDCYFDLGGKVKKFVGSLDTVDWDNGQSAGGLVVTFEANLSLMREFFDFSRPKFRDKPHFGDIADIVGGLKEVVPEIDEIAFTRQVVEVFARRLDLELVEGSLSKAEMSRVTQLANGLDTDGWKFDVVHPDLGNLKKELG